MIEVEEKSIGVIFPSQQIKMVAMQPHIHLTDTEPFQWPDDKKTEQIAGIDRTLEIAKNIQAHFTLFPECSIPGLDGIRRIDGVIANNDGAIWPIISNNSSINSINPVHSRYGIFRKKSEVDLLIFGYFERPLYSSNLFLFFAIRPSKRLSICQVDMRLHCNHLNPITWKSKLQRNFHNLNHLTSLF